MNKVAVYGGLGNQMFQYAFCTALNEKGKKSQLSFLGYLHYKHHTGFELPRAFKVKLPLHKKLLFLFMEYATVLYRNKVAETVLRKVVGVYEKREKVYAEKKEFNYDDEVFKQNNTFFIGTWQSEKYLLEAKDKIKAQFEFKKPADKKNIIMAEKIKNTNSVSVHVRRGDYLNEHWRERLEVIKDAGYYKQAAEYISEKTDNPYFFIFSDDIDWVKNNLQLPNCTYVDFNTKKKSFADMYLMAGCKHNIIANSSFSWWAAWLNKFENKIVIMPNRYMNNANCEELYPASWIKLKV
jgi:Glycosyl transferase family 11